MKKVRFVNMDPKSVRFMAREIVILRRLDHQNVMKLEGIATSRMSGSLYLVFEYMEHDLAGLAANPRIKYTEAQIKCYMQQLLRGLEHCHKRGILHRDIKGSNLLINNDGVLKIADFGLATFYQPDQNLPLTSRVVTLWYRAPELLLGATEYGPAIDMWSAGCILAELFIGKHIMPGRTEVEQMHKIFKLCGSPSEAYWTKTKFPRATSFKPQQPYIRRVAETFKNFPPSALTLVDKLLSMEPQDRGSATSALRSGFFRTEPLPSDPSSLPRYPPSKELDVKIRDQEARRQKAEAESARRGAGDTKKAPPSEFTAQGQPRTAGRSYKYNIQEDGGPSFRTEPPKKNGVEHSASVIHPSAAGLSLNKSVDCIRNNPDSFFAGDAPSSSGWLLPPLLDLLVVALCHSSSNHMFKQGQHHEVDLLGRRDVVGLPADLTAVSLCLVVVFIDVRVSPLCRSAMVRNLFPRYLYDFRGHELPLQPSSMINALLPLLSHSAVMFGN
ncbi:hypothetical protein OIU85_003294 [Salix viminalis]|uniref:Protein kinase domain-containing protein n=1 Tax=Salix viminalis TaxID=40686 RepID=A0A9Q0T0I8_SALVM|nr:hypothetical protein OIU85_003294 [Salix viminalis]